MFTGIVTAIGAVRAARRTARGLELEITAGYRGLGVGESIAVNGACLTVEWKGRGWFGVQVIRTTLARTRLGALRPGDRVNLERAVRVGDRLGGHLVQGHVDGIGEVVRVRERKTARLVDLRVPRAVAHCSIPLGSIAVDGVSLTVNAKSKPGIIQVALIPHTRDRTTLGALEEGDLVQVEGDLIGKYVRAVLGQRRKTPSP